MANKLLPPNSGNGIILAVLRMVLSLSVILFTLLFFAWSWDYWQAYLYTLANLFILAITLFVLRNNPGILHERSKPGPGMKKWDKIYFSITTPLYFIALVVASLDAGRFGWSKDIPVWTYVVFYTIYFIAQGFFLWAKKVNTYLSSVARIQKDRGQKVIETGPYRFVRHPSYLSGIVFTLATPPLLGSWWALIPSFLFSVALVIRTKLEDDMLQKELPGYKQYIKTVKYRLIPLVW